MQSACGTQGETISETSSKIKEYHFNASHGWYCRAVNKRFNLRFGKLHGEAESADFQGAEKFIPEVTKFIVDYFDGPEFVYNADEFGLNYKKVPTSSLQLPDNKMRGFKPNKICVTGMVCGNLAGEKLKPLIIGKFQNPRDLPKDSARRDKLACYYEANKSSWMTGSLYWKWFLSCFIPEMEKRHGEDFYVLLLVDNCAAHPEVVGTLDPRVIMMFLPPNTTSLIQPMDQGVIRNLKLKFHDILYRQLINHIDYRCASV
ncbi:unnamed protein product [Meganyctiphanes norvegica]|uniref:DDE-1 domain-containing protein n=1 Tax=Meganyctiphanes norvegica TaxID=48144 RepID=A0AAV2PTW8_MEGNR